MSSKTASARPTAKLFSRRAKSVLLTFSSLMHLMTSSKPLSLCLKRLSRR